MPAYNFKSQFSADVESGRKRQTIRPPRQRAIKVGDRLYLYTGMRTKACRKLRESVCTAVEPISIMDVGDVRLGGRRLSLAEVGHLCVADGFTHQSEFYEFFQRHYGLPFEGELIRWT